MDKKVMQFAYSALIATLATTAGYLIAPIEVRFLASLTSNTALIGLTFALGSLFFAILSLWLGRLSDRMGRNKLILVGCVLGIIYPLFYASTYNIFQYMGLRFVWAFSGVACGPIFMAHLQDLLKDLKKKGEYMGYVYSAQSILGAGAAFLGGYLSDTYGLTSPYFIMSVIFVLATLLALGQGKTNHRQSNGKRSIFFSVQYLFSKPSLVFYFIHNAAFSLNWGIKAMLWPLIIFGMTGKDTITGSVFATMGVVAFFVLPFAGKFVDRMGVFPSATISSLILGISGLVIAFSPDVSFLWVAAVFFAVGEALYGPTQAVLLTDHIESQYRGEMMGLDTVIDNVLGTLSPFIAGMFLVLFDAQVILLFFIALFWVALILGNLFYVYKIRNH